MAMNENGVTEQIDERFLTLKEVRTRYNLCTASIYGRIQAGKFPAPLKFGRSSRWRLSELADWEAGLSRMQSARSPVSKRG